MIDYGYFFEKSTEIKSLIKGLEELSGPIYLHGADATAYSFLATALAKICGRDVLVYFEDDMKARAALRMYEDVEYLSPTNHVFGSSFSHSREEDAQRSETLLRLTESGRSPVTLFCSVVCAVEKYPLFTEEKSTYSLRVGEKISPAHFFNFLYESGYEKVSYIAQKCEMSVRGGIIDLFSPLHEMPIRIELFGDEIASIRVFDLATQSSVRRIAECLIYSGESGGTGRRSGGGGVPLEAYLKNPIVFLIGVSSSLTRLKQNEEDFIHRTTEYFSEHESLSLPVLLHQEGIVPEGEGSEGILSALRYTVSETLQRFEKMQLVVTEILHKTLDDFRVAQVISFAPKEMYGDLGVVLSEIRRLQYAGYRLYASFFTEEKLKRFIEMLMEKKYDAPFTVVKSREEFNAKRSELYDESFVSVLYLVVSPLEKGMIFDTFHSAVITETELFAPKKRSSARPRAAVPGIKAFSELNPGDYVVHDVYGIGEFAGVRQIVTEGIRRDYLRVNYAGSDVLYLPVESAGAIRKYIGADKEKVKVSHMGGLAWKNQVSRAKKGIEDIADELIELYARRQSKIGFAFGPDTQWQQEFEDLFPYEETPDQIRATEEIKRDMESRIPMDRLLSGDVGYGKTEVALRAAFKAVGDSKQVAFLVPTTVLAQQHFNNVRERFSKYPVRVEMISRFRNSAEIRQILKKVKNGEIDILIGTHRLLSKDVVFRDLGLLIVDEEQRFGVKHKESIKFMKEHVDVLTLTATPIPRTLHMSILGVRDMSVLEDPPAERSPVQTYVMEYSGSVVREAILREVERGGQVYYVYNRIDGIERIAEELREMLPSVSLRTAHGRMGEEELEKIMLDFMEGAFDVLVSTTIIETGLDIANVNTMIVRNADTLGLSQLYQLRGRVGRSARRGYCYAFFQKGKQLTEVQERRLRAIREFTDLGAGFKIAMKDLEIRGAGNLLGTAQSGFMETVGYDLFVRMLDETLRKRKGEQLDERVEARIELKVNAYIPDDYVSDSQERIAIYKRISGGESTMDFIQNELEDRYGAVPIPVGNLFRIAEIKFMCESVGVSLLREAAGNIYLVFHENMKFDLFKLGGLLNDHPEISYMTGSSEELRIAKGEGEDWLKELAKNVKIVYNYLM